MQKHFIVQHFNDFSVVKHTNNGGQSYAEKRFYANKHMDLVKFSKDLEDQGYQEHNPWRR